MESNPYYDSLRGRHSRHGVFPAPAILPEEDKLETGSRGPGLGLWLGVLIRT
jgi:hypothetical protein